MEKQEAVKYWGFYLIAIMTYNITIMIFLYISCIKSKQNIKKNILIFFKSSSIFFSIIYCGFMMISSFGPIYIFNIICIIIAFLSIGFIFPRRNEYKLRLMFNIGTAIIMYFFNIMVIVLNQDQDSKNLVLNFKNQEAMVIPAIGCATQTSYLICNFILLKYEHYKLFVVTSEHPNEICSICLDDLSAKSVAKLKCSHYYHKDCILESFKNNSKCPICRTDVAIELC